MDPEEYSQNHSAHGFLEDRSDSSWGRKWMPGKCSPQEEEEGLIPSPPAATRGQQTREALRRCWRTAPRYSDHPTSLFLVMGLDPCRPV